LLPHRYAVAATEDKLREFEAKKAHADAARAKEEEELSGKVKSLEGKSVTIAARATEKGGLFKTLGVPDVARAIRAEHGVDIPESSIECEPMKATGEHKARLRSKHSKAELAVVIAAQ
jgi:large subunit ribosomal protein L9